MGKVIVDVVLLFASSSSCVVRRASCVVPRASCVVRRPSCVSRSLENGALESLGGHVGLQGAKRQMLRIIEFGELERRKHYVSWYSVKMRVCFLKGRFSDAFGGHPLKPHEYEGSGRHFGKSLFVWAIFSWAILSDRRFAPTFFDTKVFGPQKVQHVDHRFFEALCVSPYVLLSEQHERGKTHKT